MGGSGLYRIVLPRFLCSSVSCMLRAKRLYCSSVFLPQRFLGLMYPASLHRKEMGLPTLSLPRTSLLTKLHDQKQRKLQCLQLISSFTTQSSHFSSPTILKNQYPLQVKRPLRKKLYKFQDDEKTIQVDNVVAYAVSEEVNLNHLESHLLKQGLYKVAQLPQDVTNALHVRGKYNVDQKPKEIFIFEDGSVVFWCVPEVERVAFLRTMSKYSVAPYAMTLTLYEREEMDFTYAKGKTRLSGDIIQLSETDQDPSHRLLELYTFSNAMAQSVKLAMWESNLEKYVSSIERVTDDLRHGRKISMSRRQVLMKTGELFSLKHLINLSSDLLDTPDFYWDREVLEPLYQSLLAYLNIARRTRVMNERLNHCCELTQLLSSQLNDAHHTRLEVMIIILILVEVVFEIVHYTERYMSKLEHSESLASLDNS